MTGGLEQGRDALEAAKKELKEETGLVAESWINLGYFYPINGYASEKCTAFLAKDLTEGESKLEPTEDITVKKISIDDVVEMIRKNKITCGITVAAVYKYLLYKKGKHV